MQHRDPSSLPSSADSRSQWVRKVVILPVLAHLGLLLVWNLGQNLGLTLSLVALGFVGLIVAERRWPDQIRGSSLWPILAVAVILRVLLLPLPPTLSGDVERYVWDGRVLRNGDNPYLLPPEAEALSELRDPLWERLHHRRVPTVYPPLAEGLFAIAAGLPGSVRALKIALVLLDLGTCMLLWALARRWSLPTERILWYAWNPLVTVEIAGMGHVDGLGVALVVLVTMLLARAPQRSGIAAVAAAGAVLSKLVPILAIPVWARQSRRPAGFVLLALLISVIGLLPVWLSVGGPPPGLVEYGISWEFNGPLFEPLWRLLDRSDLTAWVEAQIDRGREASTDRAFWNRLYPYNYPQLWAKILLTPVFLGALIWSWRTRNTVDALRRVFGSVLIFSATVYPWYALWVLPWAALHRQRAWLLLSGSLFLSYIPQFWGVPLFPWVQILIWLPFLVLMGLEIRWSTR